MLGHWVFWIGALFMVIFIRYLLFSGLYHYVLRLRLRDRLRHRIFHYEVGAGAQVRREIQRSAIVSLIFAAFGILVLYLWQEDHTQLYLTLTGTRDVIWLLLGPLLFLLAQETYYYWIHRWMHRPGIYERVHRWHHESIETTAWTAFSFHPTEAVLQAVFLPLSVMIIPMHALAFLTLLAIMTLSATINHAGIEVFPARWSKVPVVRGLIGATHHDVHHKQARYNFGLYFTFWDRWMGTESPGFRERFRRFTNPED
ncbi:sterol desaturase family protein [Lewinella sp. JB7]|uniref:sterol desaturase family protein n=1 Tax=Lewinella sp. JB7 TaxID=2962887 RepID=UPI0020C9E972|nr:sterol desaturase family protein [Lewinella sp. JB7]MCP9235360.1 sterol desaturase family protein [Lewinella sp. JB7]